MQIFNIVQVLGLLAVGASALPAPANVAAVQPVEGGQLEARGKVGSCPPQCLDVKGAKPGHLQARSKFSSNSWTGYRTANSGYEDHVTKYECSYCHTNWDTTSEVQSHISRNHQAQGGDTTHYKPVTVKNN
ncbi:hypothetical protein PspLS_10173 [Pyricularia sp. CBS 133598]|nr:hypothetical protein PspLS_10173 [Pyricularia sp. CBS 133598]